MDWYVVQAYSGYELKVKAALEERIALADLKSQFGEILIPTEQVVELKSGAKKKTERKFFPGYILIEMEMNDDTWQLVKHTPRISTFVGGTKEKPMPISKAEVDGIINRMKLVKKRRDLKHYLSQVKWSEFVMDHLTTSMEL